MRILTRENLLDILYGCTILGTGGGGSLEEGVEMIDEALNAGKEFKLVTFDEMDEETVCNYVRAAKPYDKAGAYAIQGLASAYISGIVGDYFNVVGLPVHRMCRLHHEIFKENLL